MWGFLSRSRRSQFGVCHVHLFFFSLTVTAKKLRHSASFPLAGDIQIGMEDKKGQLEVEVIRARSLTQKPGSKSTPGKERWYWVWTGESDISKKIKIFTAFEFYVLRFASSDWLKRQLFCILWFYKSGSGLSLHHYSVRKYKEEYYHIKKSLVMIVS